MRQRHSNRVNDIYTYKVIGTEIELLRQSAIHRKSETERQKGFQGRQREGEFRDVKVELE